jgi:hypothetical protein
MTPEEWLACDDPFKMLVFLYGQADERKLRLFGVACCRRIWPQLKSVKSRRAVEYAEGYVDGEVSRKAMITAGAAAHAPVRAAFARSKVGWADAVVRVALAARKTASSDAWYAGAEAAINTAFSVGPAERLHQCNLVRDIFDPFRTVVVNPDWFTPTVVLLAQAAYTERLLPSGELDRDRLLILADALEEVGGATDLLQLLRSGGPHVRGCAVVDALLGKLRLTTAATRRGP